MTFHALVHVAQIAALPGQRDNPVTGLGLIQPAFRHCEATQRSIDILGHVRGITAYVEMCAILQPAPKVLCVLRHAVLHIDFLAVIAGKGDVESTQSAVLFPRGQFILVEKVGCPVSRKARNGAMPVPGPTMITGTEGSAGKRKWLVWT